MSNQSVTFTINLGGNAYKGVLQLDNAVEQVLGTVKDATNAFDRFGKNALNFDVITNSISKISQAFQSVVGSSLDFEQQQANLRTLLNGDTEATERLVGQIREYGKATVYSRGGLIEAQKTMMSFGLDAEYAFGKLKNIGDIALGDEQKMQSLALAFSQMSSTGKLMGQDFNQMVNAGFNPLKIISEKTGESLDELKEKMSKGAISADMVAQAFEWATEEGGLFYQGAETAAETTAGKIAKMNDTIDDLKIKLFEATGGATAWIAEIGNMATPITELYPLIAGMFNGIKKGVGLCIKQIGALSLSIKAAGGFFPWLEGVASLSCKGISAAIGSIPIVGWIAIAITAIGSLFVYLYSEVEEFRSSMDAFGSSFFALFMGPVFHAILSVARHWDSLKTAFTDGGILAGIKRIGFVLIDAMVNPVQILLDLLAKIPGLGYLASKGSSLISGMRDYLDKATYVAPSKTTETIDPSIPLQPDIDWSEFDNILDGETGKGKLKAGELGGMAGTVAGKCQQINITLGSMVGTMNFNGVLSENRASVEQILTEMMARVLGMAETAS